jgi:hypothetical protein
VVVTQASTASGRFYSQSYSFTIGTPVSATGSNQTVQVVVQHDTFPSQTGTGWILFGAASGDVSSQDQDSVSQINFSSSLLI